MKLNKNYIATSLLVALCAAGFPLSAMAAEDSEAMKKAEALYKQLSNKNQKKVADAYREVIRTEPDNSKAHHRLGAVLATMDQYETAILECKQSVKLDPKSYLPHVIMGQVYANQGKWADAVKELDQAVALKPDSYRAWMDLGVVHARTNNIDEAIRVYGKAAQLKPNDPAAHLNLGVFLGNKGEHKKAIEELNSAIKLEDGKNFVTYLNLGNVYGDAKEDDKAIEAFKTSLKLNGGNALSHSGLGWAYERKGEMTQAIKEQKIAMKLAPTFPQPVYRYACVLALQGKKNEAEAEFKRAINMKAKDPFAYVEYSKFLKSQNREDEAKKLLQSVQIAKEGNGKTGN